MLRCKGYGRSAALSGHYSAKLRQTGYGEETAFVPQACITARKTLKTGCAVLTNSQTYKLANSQTYIPTKTIKFTCPLRAADLPGSGPPRQRASRRDSLFSRFSFGSASSSDGGFAVCGVMAVRGESSHKPSPRKRQRALSLDADTKGFLGFGFKTKIHRICRVRHFFI